MRTIVLRCITTAVSVLLISACGGDSPTAPGATAPTSPSASSSLVSNDLAVSAGNAIASDLESLSADENAAGIGTGALAAELSLAPRFSEGTTASSTPASASTSTCTFNSTTRLYTCISSTPLGEWDCVLNATTKLYTCTKLQKDPPATSTPPVAPPTTPAATTPSITNSCSYDSATHIYTCIKTAPDTGWECKLDSATKLYTCTKKVDSPTSTAPSTPPTTTSKPADPLHPSEVCLLDPVTHLYTCTVSNHDSSTSVRSYGYFDIDGNPMSSFVKGTTAAIRYITRTDGVVAHDSANRTVTHQLRDLMVSGFLGATRIWNGAGTSSDTTVHSEGAARRTYTGVSVDTLKAVTYAEERATNPYPLSGSSIKVMNYTVVSIGKSTETTTVSQRAVVTYNGTKDVPIQLGVFTCTLHLDTHKVDGCK